MIQNWNLTPTEAVALQKELRQQVKLEPLDKETKYVAGADISFNKYSETVYAGVVVLQLPELVEVDRSLVVSKATFPYIPGLLSFREIPSLLEAWETLRHKPDVVIMDGQGIAHPRRLGIASHFGLLTNVPTVGCAKSLLVGKYAGLGNQPGDTAPIIDRSETVGFALRTKTNVQPVFVSPGHRITFDESLRLVLRCITKYRLPETTRLAHNLVNQLRTSHLPKKTGGQTELF